jgi:TPR repeat protein
MNKASMRTLAAAWALWSALGIAPAGAQPAGSADHAAGLVHYEAGRYAEALTSFTKAAHAGHVRSQEIAGLMNLMGARLYGEGIGEDRAAARRWLGRAALQGSDVAVLIVRRMDESAPSVAMEPPR